MPTESPDVRILPVLESDIDALVELARAIWYRHYPDIISVEQIEYMLNQRYHPDLIRTQLASGRAWWDKLVSNDAMIAFSSCELSDRPGEMKLDKIYMDDYVMAKELDGERQR